MKQISLEMAVSEILHYVWDPIGVSIFPNARDEYETYTFEILKMLQEPLTTSEDIANYLYLIRTETMGINPGKRVKEIKQKDKRIANLIIDWKDSLQSMQ